MIVSTDTPISLATSCWRSPRRMRCRRTSTHPLRFAERVALLDHATRTAGLGRTPPHQGTAHDDGLSTLHAVLKAAWHGLGSAGPGGSNGAGTLSPLSLYASASSMQAASWAFVGLGLLQTASQAL